MYIQKDNQELYLIVSLFFDNVKVLRPFLLRRLKKEVESQLPEKVRKKIIILMTSKIIQLSIYPKLENTDILISPHHHM